MIKKQNSVKWPFYHFSSKINANASNVAWYNNIYYLTWKITSTSKWYSDKFRLTPFLRTPLVRELLHIGQINSVITCKTRALGSSQDAVQQGVQGQQCSLIQARVLQTLQTGHTSIYGLLYLSYDYIDASVKTD